MNQDRIVGAAKEISGTTKEAIGKVIGNAALETTGTSEKVEGRIQSAIGALKDTLKK